MKMAQLIGIDETELRGFLKSMPDIWHDRKGFLERGIDLLLSDFVDCGHILSSTHIFNITTGFLVLLIEYLRDVGAATFKIYAYQPWFTGLCSDEIMERRFMDMIMEYEDKDMSSFREIAYLRIFVCPNCHAQYSFRVLVMRDDGMIQCQNCGKFVGVTEPHSESEMQSINNDEDNLEHLS
ncbi:MAG: hypothetical protein ACFFEF_16740 [Candidatus Thorarchaeota archaeon]